MKQIVRREQVKKMLSLKRDVIRAELSKKRRETEFRVRLAKRPLSEITVERIEVLDNQLKDVMSKINRLDNSPAQIHTVTTEMIQERVAILRTNGKILDSVQKKIQYKLMTGQKTQLAQKMKRRDNLLKEQATLADELAILTKPEEEENAD